MASFTMVIISFCLEFMRNDPFYLVFVTASFTWIHILYSVNPAGPAARVDGGDGGGEGHEIAEGQQGANVNYGYLSTGALLRKCCRDGLDSMPGRARILPTDTLYFVIVYLLGWGWVFGEEEGNEAVAGGEGNEEVGEDLSAWVVLKGRMVEGLRVGLAPLEVPLEWWSCNWKGFLLLLGLVTLWSFVFEPDLSEPQDDLAEGNHTIAVVEVPEVVPVHCKPPHMIS